MRINNSDYSCSAPAFAATAQQYKSAVKYLKHERRIGRNSVIKNQLKTIENGIKYHWPFAFLKKRINLNPVSFRFSNSSKAYDMSQIGIRAFNIDKLEGIQYGIDVFKDLSMREIIFLAYRTTNLAIKRGCANLCEHCFQNAVPAKKGELSEMPFEDFKKISDGFDTINDRINSVLENTKNKPAFIGTQNNDLCSDICAETIAYFFDSDGMKVVSKDRSGKEHDFIELAELLHKTTGKKMLFDTAGWNPKNKALQDRAERYAEYFSQPDIMKKVDQVNLSVNTFNPLYIKAYKLGYRAGKENDLTNPDIQKAKISYDRYIEIISNMIVTLGLSKNATLLLTYSTKSEPNMEGVRFSDLKNILNDVQKKCEEMLKSKYSGEEFTEKFESIKSMIDSSISFEENRNKCHSNRCRYIGRYKDLYNSRNPQKPEDDFGFTSTIGDINRLSPDEYEKFFKNHFAFIDTNGQIYYKYIFYDNSLRSLGKALNISTNGMKTPEIYNIEHRDSI